MEVVYFGLTYEKKYYVSYFGDFSVWHACVRLLVWLKREMNM